MQVHQLFKKLIHPMPEVTPVQNNAGGDLTVVDVIAPPAIEVDFDHLKMGDRYFRTLFIAGYPRYVSANWLEPLISFNHTLDVAMYIYPTRSEEVLENLKRKVGEMEATIQSDMKRGRVIEPSTQVALEDALSLQQELAKGAERFFQFGLYVTIPARSLEDLNKTTKQVEATLASLLIVTKKAVLQMEEGFKTTLPMGQDRLMITRNMDTASLATTFPFTTSELTANEGIMYGLNEHNDSLVIFDRFTLENANMVVFGKSIAQWESVVIRQNGHVRLEKIGPYIERLIDQHGITHKEGDVEGVKNPGIEVFSYDKHLKGQWTNVSVAARKLFSRREKLYTVTTRSGRSITVTADHSLVVLQNGQLRSVRGRTVRVGEAVPLSRFLPEPQTTTEALEPRELVPAWPRSLPQVLSYDENLLVLLGLATSEGLVRENTLSIYNTDLSVLAVINATAMAIGAYTAPRWAYPKHTLAGYNIQPNVYAKLFVALGAGGNSGTKRVPPVIFSLSNTKVAAYLRAYFEGDGTVGEADVSCTSKSRELISDIAYLLLRFGIIGRIRKKQKCAASTPHKRNTYYELVVSGSTHIERFVRHVGFLCERKKNKLMRLLGKRNNTNVDVIPTLESTLSSIYHRLYAGDDVRAPANLSPLMRGAFTPSPKQLRRLIDTFEQRITQLEQEKSKLQQLKRLPELSTFCIIHARHRRQNALLWQELGQSWRLMKQRVVAPRLVNVLRAYKTVSGETITAPEVKELLYHGFTTLGLSLFHHNRSLWSAVVDRKSSDTDYQTVYEAIKALFRRYRLLQRQLIYVKKKIRQLKQLVDCELFWDPIVNVVKIKHQEKYVYDLTVDNQVFLAGHGGMFVHNSGSGKSYMVKLEVMRSLMFGTDVIIIDPENEYEAMSHALGGEYIRFRFGTTTKVNPFDLTLLTDTSEGESELNQKILSLHGFFRVVMGNLTATEDALLDRALILTYKQKGITPDPATQKKEPPLMEDLYKTLIGMEDAIARGLADRIEKFVKGSLVGIFDQQTNIEIRNPLTIFSIRDLEDELRPIAMYLILDYIWTKIRRNLKKRILVVDEAWYMMKYPDSAQFLNSIAKRARKYYLGLTTITQDVEDFLSIDLGKTIIQNSSLQILLKQSAAAIDRVAEVFYLSEGEKHLLLSSDIGEGLFFAGPAHAAIRVIASPEEHELISTKPQELEKKQAPVIGMPPVQVPHDHKMPEAAPVRNDSFQKQPQRPIFTVETVTTE